ncbi:MAG: hypothetical protein AAF591_06080 [Verrucomicrobiota bacterium]
MPSPAVIEEFKRLTQETLTYEGKRGILAGIVSELVDILESAADFKIDPEKDVVEGESYSGQGVAISPTQAAMCAGEFQRTAIFLRGLHDAINKALESKSGTPVRVLYAGSGPYATLAVPLMTLFPPEKVRFHILDMHKVSIASVKSIVRRFGLSDSVESYAIADACHYTIPEDAIPDVILSETMNTALEREPQVSIMRHLLGQAPDALLVPESVRVHAFLVDTTKKVTVIIPDPDGPLPKSQPERIPLGPVFELNAEAIRSWANHTGDYLPAEVVHLPPSPEPRFKPFLFTTIVTHGDHILRTHDSSLTGLRPFPKIKNPVGKLQIQFSYRLGDSPALVAEA